MTLYHIAYVDGGKTLVLIGTNGVIGGCYIGW
jgi:hypothetical protein